MNWKFAPALSAMLTLAGSFLLPGCGGDDCTRASDHKAECVMNTSTSSTSTGGMQEACSGALLCQSECINQFTCEQINGMVPAYVSCLTACQGK